MIPVFNRSYRVSPKGMFNPEGRQPSMAICVILSKYLLLCPESLPDAGEWCAYRDFKDSGPLTVYFENDVIKAIINYFGNDLNSLDNAARAMGGTAPQLFFNNDPAVQFEALPKIPMLLLYHQPDDEFPAGCSVLFKKSAESYLDGECLAMSANYPAKALIKKAKSA